jgi:hypothetical protein
MRRHRLTRSRRFGTQSLALLGLTAVSLFSASGTGCSAKKPTELVPGVESQVVVPQDLQAVRVVVQVAGSTKFDQCYQVNQQGTNGAVELPSTLGVVSGEPSGTQVAITVEGYQDGSSENCQIAGSPIMAGTGGSQILRRSIQTFVDQRTLFVPMPLSYSCWNSDCGDQGMSCKGNTCVDATMVDSQLVDYDPSLVDGTDVCFSPGTCFGDDPEGGTNRTVPPLLLDADSCTYALPVIPGFATPPGQINVRAYFQNFQWAPGAGGVMQPMLKSGGEQEILNEDPVEGFTVVPAPADAGAPDGGSAAFGTTFKLATGLCQLVHQASNPPAAPPTGAADYITISDLRVAGFCPPKIPLLPVCHGEQTNGPALPNGETTTDLTCNVGVSLSPTQSALYLVMDHSAVMHGAFGPMGSATALALSLSDPVFKRTYAAFKFLPGQPSDCTTPASMVQSFSMPDIDFELAASAQSQIATKLDDWTATDTTASPSPLDLQASLRLDAGGYAHVLSFLQNKELPNIAAVMFFVNRAPDLTNDCSPPLNGQATVQAAVESQILAAYNGTPSLQTYFVVLDDDAHDESTATGALTFFDKVQADLPQAVQVIDATQSSTNMQAAQTAAANFSKLVTQLGTCVYDYSLPATTDPSKVEVAYTLAGQAQTLIPANANCSLANQSSVDGWAVDSGRLRICGKSCNDLRNGVLASAAAALQSGTPDQDVPVTATVVCQGSAPVSDAGPQNPNGTTSTGGSDGSSGVSGSSGGNSTNFPDDSGFSDANLVGDDSSSPFPIDP